jgi:hypothetical protein
MRSELMRVLCALKCSIRLRAHGCALHLVNAQLVVK